MMELSWIAAAKKQREENLLKLSNFQEMTWPIKRNYSVDLMFHYSSDAISLARFPMVSLLSIPFFSSVFLVLEQSQFLNQGLLLVLEIPCLSHLLLASGLWLKL